jgi:hypothetical protein
MTMAMVISRSDRVLTLVYGVEAPTDDEWTRCVALCRERAGRDSRVLVETHGGGPDAKQRRVLAEAMRNEDTRVAVMTDSLVARGILTALAWLGLPQRGFALNDLRAAGAYLELSSDELRLAAEELARLRFELGFHEAKRAVNG